MEFLMSTFDKSRAIDRAHWKVGAWLQCSHMHRLIAMIGADIIALQIHSSNHEFHKQYPAPPTCQAEFYEILLVASLLSV